MTSDDVTAARQALIEHPHYRYRGCAPDAVQGAVKGEPPRCAGDPGLTVDAWLVSTADGPEPPKERAARQEAAKAVCGRCPVLGLCRAWASSVGDDGHLADEYNVAGGQTSLERSRDRIAALQPEPEVVAGPSVQDLEQCRTTPRQAVLRALAGSGDQHVVAAAAGMDLRTANWHRSHLCRLLHLDRGSATRQELLAAAAEHGVLPAGVVVVEARVVVPAAPVSDGTRQRAVAPRPEQLALDWAEPAGEAARGGGAVLMEAAA